MATAPPPEALRPRARREACAAGLAICQPFGRLLFGVRRCRRRSDLRLLPSRSGYCARLYDRGRGEGRLLPAFLVATLVQAGAHGAMATCAGLLGQALCNGQSGAPAAFVDSPRLSFSPLVLCFLGAGAAFVKTGAGTLAIYGQKRATFRVGAAVRREVAGAVLRAGRADRSAARAHAAVTVRLREVERGVDEGVLAGIRAAANLVPLAGRARPALLAAGPGLPRGAPALRPGSRPGAPPAAGRPRPGFPPRRAAPRRRRRAGAPPRSLAHLRRVLARSPRPRRRRRRGRPGVCAGRRRPGSPLRGQRGPRRPRVAGRRGGDRTQRPRRRPGLPRRLRRGLLPDVPPPQGSGGRPHRRRAGSVCARRARRRPRRPRG